MTSTEEKIKQLIVDKLGVDEKEVTNEASFTADLCADSLDVFEMIIEIEEVFHLTIPAEDMDRLKTVGSLYQYITVKSTHKIPGAVPSVH